ncbi:zinc-binding dehydrogenase [Xylariales sp. PMI_506]|nr:zinc-binding dehydrogenase [Xylariales sp. PMI_506]
MKALVTTQDKTEHAEIRDIHPTPVPVEGEILVQVHYVAQNPTDWRTLATTPPGRIVGCDFAGTVADGNGSSWQDGQRVAGFIQGRAVNPTRGAFAEYLVIDASLVYAVPDSVELRDAAAIPLAFATAVQALFQRLSVPEPSEPASSPFPILINGGTSSVGIYAVQLAKLAGLYVIATGSKRHHEYLSSLGADVVVDYQDKDWIEKIKLLSNDGLHHAFDCVAKSETLQAIASAMSSTEGGHVVCIVPRNEDEVPSVIGKVKIESTLVYTVFNRPIESNYRPFDYFSADMIHDRKYWEKYLTLLPDYLKSGQIKPNPVRELGGLGDIVSGFALHRDGKVSAEKLVYKIV